MFGCAQLSHQGAVWGLQRRPELRRDKSSVADGIEIALRRVVKPLLGDLTMTCLT